MAQWAAAGMSMVSVVPNDPFSSAPCSLWAFWPRAVAPMRSTLRAGARRESTTAGAGGLDL